MRSISDIFEELHQHPDYLGGVVWTIEDLVMAMKDHTEHDGSKYSASVEDIASAMKLKYWEEAAIEDGWQYIDRVLWDFDDSLEDN
jgi:hypothetical protein